MIEKIWNGIEKWLKQPFNERGSVIDWFLFMGLLIAISFLWSRIIARI